MTVNLSFDDEDGVVDIFFFFVIDLNNEHYQDQDESSGLVFGRLHQCNSKK